MKRFIKTCIAVVVCVLSVLQGVSQTITIGYGTSEGNKAPYENYYKNSTSQTIYTASEIGRAGAIASIAYNVANPVSLADQSVKIYMGYTTLNTFSTVEDAISASDVTLVYSGTVTLGESAGWEKIVLNKVFDYNGEDNLVVIVTRTSTAYKSLLHYYCSQGASLSRCNDDNSNYGDLSSGIGYKKLSYRANIQIGFAPEKIDGYYQISDAEDLQWFAQYVNLGNASVNAKLLNDIDLTDVDWTAIGTSTNRFKGIFDGNEHTINNLTASTGIFGWIESAEIRNLGVKDVAISASTDYIGGIVGRDNGGSIIEKCYCTGSITSSNSYVGGVIGYSYHSTIQNCYSQVSVSGTNYVGGICGYMINEGKMSNVYVGSSTSRQIEATGHSAGGIVGSAGNSSLSSCYVLKGISITAPNFSGAVVGQSASTNTFKKCEYKTYSAKDGGSTSQNGCGNATSGSTTVDVSGLTSFSDNIQATGKYCYLLNNSENAGSVWRQTIGEDEYPVLDNSHLPVYLVGTVAYSNEEIVMQGSGTAWSPFVISNAETLCAFRDLVNLGNVSINGNITADIVLNEKVLDNGALRSDYKTALAQWEPITSFEGSLYGNNHTISGVFVKTSKENAGFFANTSNAKIKELHLKDSYVSGVSYVGGLIGRCYGSSTITADCSFEGFVDGAGSYVGGLFGMAGGTITGCVNKADVIGLSSVGGLAGCFGYYCGSATVTNCYNTGNVTGSAVTSSRIGGIAGQLAGTKISNCYNTGNIIGASEVGGCVGFSGATVSDCANFGAVVASNELAGGIVGRNTSTLSNSFNVASVSAVSSVGGVVGSNTGTVASCYYNSDNCTYGGINSLDVSGQATALTTVGFCSASLPTNFSSSIWNAGTTTTARESIVSEDNVIGYRIVGTYPSIKNVGTAQNAVLDFVNVGSEKNPEWVSDFIPIYTIADFKNIKNNLSATYVLMNDIIERDNYSSTSVFTPKEEYKWIGIGSSADPFTGKLYGNNHTISGIYVHSASGYAGVFNYVSNGLIRDFGVVDSRITGKYVGAICGKALSTNIINCYSLAEVSGVDAGGIIGNNLSASGSGTVIQQCWNGGTVSATEYAGGIAATLGFLKISECYNVGNIESDLSAGGISAMGDYSSISNCYNQGNVSAQKAGGIFGENGTVGNRKSCYNTGKISGSVNEGAICGNGSGKSEKQYCYYDKITSNVEGGINSMDSPKDAEGKETDDLCIALQDGFSSEYWAIKEPVISGNQKLMYYPYLKCFGESTAKLATYRSISKVVLNTNGGTCTDLTSYIEREGATLPQDVTRTGYTFEGWYTNVSCTSDEVTEIPVTATGEQTFYAKWSALDYEVTLDPQGGTINYGNVDSYTFGIGAALPTNVTRIGYKFLGWYKIAGSRSEVVMSSYGSNKLAVVKAVKEITGLGLKESLALVNSVDDGPVTISEVATVSEANTIIETLTTAGATVALANEANMEPVTTIGVLDYGDKEFYAEWEIIDYNIVYNVNGGTFTGIPKYTYNYGTVTQLPSIEREGYTFGYWFISPDFSSNAYAIIAPTETGDKTFYAKWIVNSYDVTLDVAGGTINSGNLSSYTYGVGAILPTDVTKTGFTFTGWIDDDTDAVATNIANNSIGDKSYTASWSQIDYTITYNANGGSFEDIPAATYNYNDEVTLPEPTRTGYNFLGWYNNSNLVGTAITTIEDTEYGNKEFWAKWEANTYAVTLNANSGEINSGNIASYTYDVLAILPQDVTKTGNTFGGWFDNEACTGTAVTQIVKGSTGNKAYYAKWTPKTYTVTLQTNNGTINAGNIVSYTYNVGATLPTDVTKNGYEFVGWFDNSSYEGGVVTEIAATEVGDRNFWAKWKNASYAVALNANGGSINSNNIDSYVYGAGVVLPTDVTKTGYRFLGWKDSENNDALAISATDFGNKAFTAQWAKATYTITYDANGGDIDNTYEVSYQLGDAITLPTTVTKAGNTFVAWYDNVNLIGEPITEIAAIEVGDKNYYAKWQANTYTVTLDAQEGTINTGNVTAYTYGVTTSLPTNVTREGYTFTGWYTNAECTSDVVSIISSTTVGNQTYYAGWSNTAYAVTLNTNNGVISAGSVISYTHGTAVQLPTTAQIEKTGYTFAGWYDNSSCTGTAQTSIAATATGDKAFWAKWTVNTYDITLNSNEGTINSGNVTKYTYGVGATLPTDITKTGCTFAGWYTTATFTGDPVDRVDEYALAAKTFYAKWIENDYSIVYETSGGVIENVGYATGYTFGTGATLPNTVSKTGYTFAGWFTNSAYEGVAVEEITATEYGMKTYYAKWNVNSYAVTLNTNGGEINSGAVAAYTFSVGATLPTNVTKNGYTFAGWYNNEELAGSEVKTIATDAYGEKKFWAKWVINTYTITLNANGGVINAGSVSDYEFATGATLPTDVTRTGYEFAGWYNNSNLTGERILTVGATETGNKSYYAKWSVLSYLVTLNTNGGTVNSGNVVAYTYSNGATLPVDVTKTGYTFAGWFSNAEFTGESILAIALDESGDKSYYAKWTPNTYAVSLIVNEGTINSGNVTDYIFGVQKTLPTDVTKVGYDFAGWYNNSNYDVKVTSIASNDFGSKTYYAKWMVKSYAVELNANGGSINANTVDTYTFGEGAILPSNVTRAGYEFAGWFDNESLSGTAVVEITTTANGDKEFWAKWQNASYAISYNNNGGIINETVASAYTFGETVVLPNNVVREGYTFAGWFDNVNLVGKAVSKVETTDFGNKTYYAKWNVNNYAVTLNANEGTINSGNVVNYVYGNGAILPSDVTKVGNTFAGWYTTADFTTPQVVRISETELGDKVFYAKWTPNTYDISLLVNEGTINSGNVTTYTYGEGVVLPSDITKDGYTFNGWYPNSSLSGDEIYEIGVDELGNKTYYAKWSANTYNISLYAADGTINAAVPTEYTYGTLTLLPTNVTREGYTFDGWYKTTMSHLSVYAVTDANMSKVAAVINRHLGSNYVAKMVYNDLDSIVSLSIPQYEMPDIGDDLEYEGFVVTVSMLGPSATVSSCDVSLISLGENATKVARLVKSYFGKTLLGDEQLPFVVAENVPFETFEKFETEVVAIGGIVEMKAVPSSASHPVMAIYTTDKGDKSFEAYWSVNSYKVTLEVNGGTNTKIVSDYTYGEGATLPTSEEISRTGYTFVGWYTSSNFDGTAVTEISKTDIGNKTFYAKWKVNSYAIALNANEGTINSGNVTNYIYGNGANLPSDVTRTGYKFGGWYNVTDSTKQVVRIDEETTGDQSFFAKWTANSYNIILVVNEGTINEGNVESYIYGEGATLPSNVTKDGNTFGGWYANTTYTGGEFSGIAKNDAGDKQFWAKWTINNYEVTAIAENGSVAGAGSYEYKSTATLTATANEGYEFTGWSNGSTDNKIQIVVTKDTTVTANFKEKEKVLVAGTLTIPTMKTEREAAPIDLTGLFGTTEGSEVHCTATSSRPDVVSASVVEGKLILTVNSLEGEAEITVTATLPNGEKNSVKATAEVVLACNIQVAETIKNVSCFGESDAEIALAVKNAAMPYTTQWIGETATADTIQGIKAGNYTVSIADAEGCELTKTFTVTEPAEMTMKAVIKKPTCDNADGAITVETTGVKYATYAWSNEATTQNISKVSKGEYTLTVTNTETGCSISDTYTLTEPDAPVVTVANVVATACNEANGAVTISVSEDGLIYNWSNNKQTKNLTGVRAGDYTLEVVNPETNCKASLAVTVPSIALKQPEISLVTVSQETGKNLVVWLKENTDLIDYYTIYRETEGKDIYEMVDRVPYSELSVYEDLEADPNIRSWRYKMTATDVCGTETEMSAHHKTIHLRKNMGMNNTYNLEWDEYEGLDFSSFVIYREYKVGTVLMLDTIATLPSNVTAITDLEPVKRTTGYYIGIVLPEEINPKTQFMKAESGPFSLALSNIAEAENDEEPNAVEDVENAVVVYAIGHTIYVKNAEGKDIKIYDNNGRTIANVADENEIFVRLDGTYFVKVGNESFAVVIK